MRPIPQKLKEAILADPFYKKCARHQDGSCEGRITWEHALIFAGKQVNELYAIIPLCEYHHAVGRFQDGGDLDKDRNIQIALDRASNEQLEAISKVIDYKAKRDYLNGIYKV